MDYSAESDGEILYQKSLVEIVEEDGVFRITYLQHTTRFT